MDAPDAPAADAGLVARLRAGDADAFAEVVTAWSPAMLRAARTFVATDAAAQDAVQETWLQVVRGLHGFQGRSLLRTWVFSILANVARRRGVQDHRTVPLSALSAPDGEAGPTVDPSRFRGRGEEWAGGWRAGQAPQAWGPEERLLSSEVRDVLRVALEGLPSRQGEVVALRDVHGLGTDEVAALLGLSEGNVRVLLHRGRARLRHVLEDYLAPERAAADGGQC